MKRLETHILAAIVLLVATGTAARGLKSAYFTTSYKFHHKMNPAFGNSQNYVSLPVLGNVNVGMQGNFGLSDVFFDNKQFHGKMSKKLIPLSSNASMNAGFNVTL